MAEKAMTELESEYTSRQKQALLFRALNVDSKQEAYDKLTNLILVKQVSTARLKSKNKETYSEDTHEETYEENGEKKTRTKTTTISMAEYSKDNANPDMVIEETFNVLNQLFKLIGAEKKADIWAFRDSLIEIIKTKGITTVPIKMKDGKFGEITAEKARIIYTKLLIIKHKNIQDKEILMFLIGLKNHPPFVYDLSNNGRGWSVIEPQKTGPGVMEDFCLDGAVYLELKERLGMDKRKFNAYIKKITPIYEAVRSKIEALKLSNPNKAVTATDLGMGLDENDTAKFIELMSVPLWMEKMAGAFKHALYIDKIHDLTLPKIKEHQGPDKVQKIDVVFVNIEEKLDRIADRLADERLDQELKELGPQGWKQLWRLDKIGAKWWKRNAMEGYRDKYKKEIIVRLKEDPKYRTELMNLNAPGGRDQVRPGGTIAKLKNADHAPAEGVRQNLMPTSTPSPNALESPGPPKTPNPTSPPMKKMN